MPGEHNSILQDKLLNEMRQKKVSVTIFLVNGVKLQGTIVAFDTYSILLQREQMTQLIFKHAISTIMPLTPLSLRVAKDEVAGVTADSTGDDA